MKKFTETISSMIFDLKTIHTMLLIMIAISLFHMAFIKGPSYEIQLSQIMDLRFEHEAKKPQQDCSLSIKKLKETAESIYLNVPFDESQLCFNIKDFIIKEVEAVKGNERSLISIYKIGDYILYESMENKDSYSEAMQKYLIFLKFFDKVKKLKPIK
ncbi:MAG: hypothetical protein GY793_08095 [Proteobacteria bacterium]|nr:hypothetical protein [Pseudomonadota bacterium]